MARTGGRPQSQITEARPAPPRAPSPPPAEEDRPSVPEGQQTGWRLAATLWAIIFLFLAALLVFDLLAGLFRS
jgi:hypothetical protein